MNTKVMLVPVILGAAILALTQGMVLAGPSGSTAITMEISPATISITPPSPVALGQAMPGDLVGSSATPGVITVIPGTSGFPVAYSVYAADANQGPGRGFMMKGSVPLSQTNKFLISSNNTAFTPADLGITYTGLATANSTNLLPFFVKQHITGDEPKGSYNITVSFTASLP
jgi:hypothetical protein